MRQQTTPWNSTVVTIFSNFCASTSVCPPAKSFSDYNNIWECELGHGSDYTKITACCFFTCDNFTAMLASLVYCKLLFLYIIHWCQMSRQFLTWRQLSHLKYPRRNTTELPHNRITTDFGNHGVTYFTASFTNVTNNVRLYSHIISAKSIIHGNVETSGPVRLVAELIDSTVSRCGSRSWMSRSPGRMSRSL